MPITQLVFAVTVAAQSLTMGGFVAPDPTFDANGGGDIASPPLFGAGPPNAELQGRVVSLDDGGRTTTAWADIGTVSGAGTWAATIAAPRNVSWYRAEVRLKAQTGVVATNAERFAAGTAMLRVGQSEDDYFRNTFYSTAATAAPIPKLRQSIAGLQHNTKLRGRQTASAPVVFDGTGLGAGASWNAGTKVLTINSGTHWFTNYQFPDDTFIDVYGGSCGGDNCVFTSPAFSTKFAIINYRPGSTNLGWRWNNFIGSGNYSDINPVIKTANGVIAGGDTTRNYFVGFPSDVLWPAVGQAGGYTPHVSWNFIHYTSNTPPGTAAYNAGTSYAFRDGCQLNGYTYIALQATTGNAPTGSNSSNAFWQWIDPHLDSVNPVGGGGGDLVSRCNLVVCENTNRLIGVNNTLMRYDQTDAGGNVGTITVEHNRVIRAPDLASYPLQIYKSPSATLGAVIVRHNEVTVGSSGTLHGSSGGANILWGDNTDAATGAVIATPVNATATAYTDTSGDGDVAIIYHDRAQAGSGATGVQVQVVTRASYGTKQMSHMARMLMLMRPGEKFAVGYATKVGTGFQDLLDDAATARYWTDDYAVATRVAAGGSLGLCAMSWWASTAQAGVNFGGLAHQLTSGKKTDGTPVAVPGTITQGGTSFPAQHLLYHLGSATTKWLIHGPHARIPYQSNMQNAVTLVGGASENGTLMNYGIARSSLRAAFPSVHAPNVSADGISVLNFEMGRPAIGNPSVWDDQTHPGIDDDGSCRFCALNLLAMLRRLDLVGFAIPKIDNAYWAPGGAYMEMWSSVGRASTTRIERGEASIGTTYPHWTDVFAVEINGIPAEHVTIANDRIRVAPNSGTFNSSTVITFGEGGATGYLIVQSDPQAKAWKNYPIVPFAGGPIAGIEGLAIEPKPSASVLASTL